MPVEEDYDILDEQDNYMYDPALRSASKHQIGVAMTPIIIGGKRRRGDAEGREHFGNAASSYSPPAISLPQGLAVSRPAVCCVACGSNLEPPGTKFCQMCGASSAARTGGIN